MLTCMRTGMLGIQLPHGCAADCSSCSLLSSLLAHSAERALAYSQTGCKMPLHSENSTLLPFGNQVYATQDATHQWHFQEKGPLA